MRQVGSLARMRNLRLEGTESKVQKIQRGNVWM